MTHARPGMRFTIDRAHVDRVTCNQTFLRRVYDLIIVHRRAILYAPAIDPFSLLRPMLRMMVTFSRGGRRGEKLERLFRFIFFFIDSKETKMSSNFTHKKNIFQRGIN